MNVYEISAEKLDDAANMLRAIAHPLRISIINLLDNGNRLSVSEIHEVLKIEQSTASHHLGILRDKGVLIAKREGKNTYYSLKHNLMSQIVDCISKCAV